MKVRYKRGKKRGRTVPICNVFCPTGVGGGVDPSCRTEEEKRSGLDQIVKAMFDNRSKRVVVRGSDGIDVVGAVSFHKGESVEDLDGTFHVVKHLGSDGSMKGVGKALMGAVFKSAAREGEGIVLDAVGSSPGFYEKLGFRPAGQGEEGPRYVLGKEAVKALHKFEKDKPQALKTEAVRNVFCPTSKGGRIIPRSAVRPSINSASPALYWADLILNVLPTIRDTAEVVYGMMDDVTKAEAADIARTIKQGAAGGAPTALIARELQSRLGFDAARANLIAVTELTRMSSADAVSDAAKAGAGTLTFTAGPGACPRCMALNGKKFKLGEAGQTLPVHPGCNCRWKANGPTVNAATATATVAAGGNCGTGSGGFKPGNTCATGGGVPHVPMPAVHNLLTPAGLAAHIKARTGNAFTDAQLDKVEYMNPGGVAGGTFHIPKIWMGGGVLNKPLMATLTAAVSTHLPPGTKIVAKDVSAPQMQRTGFAPTWKTLPTPLPTAHAPVSQPVPVPPPPPAPVPVVPAQPSLSPGQHFNNLVPLVQVRGGGAAVHAYLHGLSATDHAALLTHLGLPPGSGSRAIAVAVQTQHANLVPLTPAPAPTPNPLPPNVVVIPPSSIPKPPKVGKPKLLKKPPLATANGTGPGQGMFDAYLPATKAGKVAAGDRFGIAALVDNHLGVHGYSPQDVLDHYAIGAVASAIEKHIKGGSVNQLDVERALKSLAVLQNNNPMPAQFPDYNGGGSTTRGPNPALDNGTRPNLTPHEEAAAQKYTTLIYRPMNHMMRAGQPLPPALQDVHDNLASAFSKTTPMASPVSVVRGMTVDPAQLTGWLANFGAGNNVSFDGYVSTTVGKAVNSHFHGNVQLNIEATHGLDMMPVTHYPGSTSHELLLNHGSAFRVKGVRTVGGVTHIDMEQLPAGSVGTKVAEPASAAKVAKAKAVTRAGDYTGSVTDRLLNSPVLSKMIRGTDPIHPANRFVSGKQETLLQDIMKERGGSDLPAVHDSATMDDLINKQGWLGAWRGVNYTPAHDQYRTGEHWIGTGMYGAGNYSAYYDPNWKFKGYGVKARVSGVGVLKGAQQSSAAQSEARVYGTTVTRFAYPPTARITDLGRLRTERTKDYKVLEADYQSGKFTRSEYMRAKEIMDDNGRYAAIKNYDAVQFPTQGYMTLLNRSVIAVQDTNV